MISSNHMDSSMRNVLAAISRAPLSPRPLTLPTAHAAYLTVLVETEPRTLNMVDKCSLY